MTGIEIPCNTNLLIFLSFVPDVTIYALRKELFWFIYLNNKKFVWKWQQDNRYHAAVSLLPKLKKLIALPLLFLLIMFNRRKGCKLLPLKSFLMNRCMFEILPVISCKKNPIYYYSELRCTTRNFAEQGNLEKNKKIEA